MQLLRKKSIEDSIAETKEKGHSLKRTLHTKDLAIMGIAVAVGAGIFSVGGQAIAFHAGPAAIISFVIAAVVCGFAALCYAELASMAPVAGSAYTFTYSTMGELAAWIIGWDMILEMLMGSAVLSKYWSIYLNDFLRLIGINITTSVAIGPLTIDLAPIVIIAFFTTLLVLGTAVGSRVNNILTIIKICVVLFVVCVGLFYVKASNFTPFIPPSEPASAVPNATAGESGVMMQPLLQWMTGAQPSIYGVAGILSGAALVFFAYIGFDIVATTSEEAVDPKRTIPRGIGLGLAIVTVLYILVALVTTGMASYRDLAQSKSPSLTTAFELVGANWAATIIAFGVVIGLTTVVMVLLLGLTRIVFAMSRDGLLPRSLSKTSSHGTPARLQVIGSVIVAIIASCFDITILSDMINIGTLSAFMLVAISIPILRKSRPDLERSFTVPGSPVIPIITALACLWLMLNLTVLTWVRFIIWLIIGFVVYFTYSYRHSRLNKPDEDLPILPNLESKTDE